MERRFDEQGRLAGWETANGSNPGFAYDVNGRLEYETNSIGVVTRSVYNEVGWLKATTNLVTGAWTAYGYDDAGRRIAQTNTYGQVTRFDYWPSGSLKAMTNAWGTNYWLYSDAAGACSSCGNSGSVTDCLARVTESVTSAHGLPLQTIRRKYAGATGPDAATNTTVYLSGLTTPEQEAEDYPIAITDEGGHTRQYEYTALGQLYRATDLSGTTWWTNQFDPDTGALTNVLSPTGETLSYAYDELDNVKTIRFGDGNWLTNFYNAENRLSGVRLPSGVSVTNFYDFAGRLTNRSSTIGETASFQYSGNDAVTVMTDNTGSTTNLYDGAGRLWGIDYPSGASVRYQLDLLDRITAITNKASPGPTAYVTRYQYDPVGNVTNVIDPFNGNTSFEYDRVGRRTKRTLPNNVVTEWQYDWRDRVTNIMHTVGGAVLAKVTYERLPGGEPSKITREDGSYVELKYDSALRLTNEVYYTNSAAQTTNSYGYDASGSRVRLVTGGVIYTNSVIAGYRVTQVKTNGNVVETYDYDSSGRVTNIARSGITLKLGYNSADQVAAVTNGTSWVTYRHDASGRRTISTNQAGTVRRLLLAPTPGTDLESPLLIANASGTVQQGYVYLGDEPLLRYTSGSTAGYYLEDGMGSVIGLAPASSPSAANTTRLFYDGFGNARATNGPSPSIPTGAGGDFRFHGAWLEEGSGLYNMRAREYDPHLGRFTARDGRKGAFRRPETLNPYPYAVNNPFVFADPSGEFTLVELNLTGSMENYFQAFRSAAIHEAKQRLKERLFESLTSQATKQLLRLVPGGNLDKFDALFKGTKFGEVLAASFCSLLGTDALPEGLNFEVGISENGEPQDDGLSCESIARGEFPSIRKGVRRPDFIIGPKPHERPGSHPTTFLVAEIKYRPITFYSDYVLNRADRAGQLDAIRHYASGHTYSYTAVFITLKRDPALYPQLKRTIGKKCAEAGCVGLLITDLHVRGRR